jgi:predicted Ser/Thr protein kinase
MSGLAKEQEPPSKKIKHETGDAVEGEVGSTPGHAGLLTIEGKEHVGRGKRGCVTRVWFEPLGRWVAIKAPREEAAVNSVPNERLFLEKLNPHGIGPRLLIGDATRVVYQYVDGVGIVEYLKECTAGQAVAVLRAVFQQCFAMDSLGISKQEMGWPEHHVLIGDDPSAPVMIDFERCRETHRPSNVSQFSNFMHMPSIRALLLPKGIDLDREHCRNFAIQYMRSGRTQESFQELVATLCVAATPKPQK